MDSFLSESLDIKRRSAELLHHPTSSFSEASRQCPTMEDVISGEFCRDLGRALCIITGASKGYGRTLAFQMSRLLKPGSVLLLVARTADQLNEVKEDIVTLYGGQNKPDVRCVQADLEKTEGVEKTLQAAKETPSSEMDHLLLINNAGVLKLVSTQITKIYSAENMFLERCSLL